MKYTLWLILSLISLGAVAQTRSYNSEIIYDSLYQRVHRMECTLYNSAINGKLKAYKTDSLKSFFKPEELKKYTETTTSYRLIQGKMYSTGSITTIAYNPETDGKGICGIYKTISSLTNPQQVVNLSSISIMYQPFVGNTDILLPVLPMFYIAYEDLKTVLSASELRFLVQLCSISMSDKENSPDNATDSLYLIMLKKNYYGHGVYNEFTKFSLITSDNLESIATNLFSYSTRLIHEDAIKLMDYYETDSTTSGHKSYDSLRMVLTRTVYLPIYNPSTGMSSTKDSTIVRYTFEDYKLLEIETNKMAILNIDNSKVYITKEKFEAIAPKWLTPFLFENF